MKLKHFIVSLIISVVCSDSFSQEITFSKRMEVSAQSIEVDELGNIYLIKNYNIYKLSPEGDTINFFSNKRYGVITSLDVSIPQKPLIFYKENGILLELDFTLSENTPPINLFSRGLVKPVLVVHSQIDNGYWVYDEAKYELSHFDKQFNSTYSSGNLMLNHNLSESSTSRLQVFNNKVYLSSEKLGVLVFDQFAAYSNKISFEGYRYFYPFLNGYIFYKNKSFLITDTSLLNAKTVSFSNEFSDFKYINDKMYFLSTNSIKIYDIK